MATQQIPGANQTVTLPQGTVVDPAAVPKCREAQLESGETGCPDASQVGTIALTLSIGAGFGEGSLTHPLYDMVAPAGSPAELGFEVLEVEILRVRNLQQYTPIADVTALTEECPPHREIEIRGDLHSLSPRGPHRFERGKSGLRPLRCIGDERSIRLLDRG